LRAALNVKFILEAELAFIENSTKSSFANTNVAPVVTLPFEPHESVPSVKSVELIPPPGEAEPVPVDGAGFVVEKLTGNVHCAIVWLGVQAGEEETVSTSEPALPVSKLSISKLLVVF
jgi:hypothetical protein